MKFTLQKKVFLIQFFLIFISISAFLYTSLSKKSQPVSNTENTLGRITESAVSTTNANLPETSGTSSTTVEKLTTGLITNTQAKSIEVHPGWVATDYQKDDINSNPYTVKSFDTLWEIAEGFYGDGFRWVEILEKNYEQIDYLPSGEKALIIEGQILKL